MRDERGRRTHRTRVLAEPNTLTIAQAYPRTEPEDLIFACDPVDFPLDD